MKCECVIRMDGDDFDRLVHTSMSWAGSDWQAQEGRFVTLASNNGVIGWNFAHAYWFSTWAEVLLARAFLLANDSAYQVLSDKAAEGPEPGYLVVTDYAVRRGAGKEGQSM